jgi:hypothetical protein
VAQGAAGDPGESGGSVEGGVIDFGRLEGLVWLLALYCSGIKTFFQIWPSTVSKPKDSSNFVRRRKIIQRCCLVGPYDPAPLNPCPLHRICAFPVYNRPIDMIGQVGQGKYKKSSVFHGLLKKSVLSAHYTTNNLK